MSNTFSDSHLPSIYPLVKCLFSFSAHFLVGLVFFLLLSFENSLYTLGSIPLLAMCFADIFSHSVTCLLILFTGSFAEEKFLMLMKSSISSFFFSGSCFCFHVYKHLCLTLDHKDLVLYFSKLKFVIYCKLMFV